ncbi:TonB-dependent receptor [Asticcacaulis sp. EMRT-3]|uniref:TonB-dependent receptor n=1 Tax=Asticcacaulis sp. EMRT-3 TaxID=3040349 RepID=UPI0024AF6223|nr:TonB-dependent receptor [Asticcacaulis sp. EMRT-3]MDI7775746.1 TonB-dependent receptor [Asticcacaulis sp. EMRT-3]
MRVKKNLVNALMGGVALVAVAYPALAAAQDSAPAASPAPAAPTSASDTTEVVVVGMRGSLAKSLHIKRDASVITDSINATELGRFPDNDVADSLSHITGITINRTTGGEGQYVSVRGLGSQYNIVTLNDRILATDDDGRDFAFDILPSDIISGADVLKSPQASAMEGSIGGTVNLRSARPFDHKGFHAALRAEGSYNDMSEYYGDKVSGFISDTTDGGHFGFLLGAVYSDTKTRSDSLNYNTYDPASPGVWPLNSNNAVVAECCISYGSIVDEKKRTALTGTLEWRPSDDIHIVADLMFTRLRDPQVAYNHSFYPDFTYDANGNPEWSHVTVNNGLITSFTGTNFTPEVVNQTVNRIVDTSLFGVNGSWNVNDHLTFDGDAYYSKADRPEGGTDTFVTAGLVSPTPYNQDTITMTANPGGLPDMTITLPGGVDYATALASGQLNDQSLWSTHYVGLSGFSIQDKITGLKLNGTWHQDTGWLQKVTFGVNYTDRSKSRRDISNDWNNGSNQYGSLYNTLDGQPGPITFATMGADVISTFNFPHFMEGAGGKFPMTMALLNANALLAGLKNLDGTPNYTSGEGVYDFSLTAPQYNPTNSYDVNEKTFAAFIEGSFSIGKWDGNLGLRMVSTRTHATTATNEILSVTVADTSNPTNPGVVQYSDITPVNAKGHYTLALPSLNLIYHIRPDLQLRLGAAEVMSRPNLNQLVPTSTNNAINQEYILYYDGNADLRPIKADQFDASLEWYYQPRDLLSVALFDKRLRDDITTAQTNNVDIGAVGCFNGDPCTALPFSINQPVNGDKADIYGIELSWQHILDNGFGVHAEYTHTWSKTVIDGQSAGPEAGVSPTTFSANVFYEHGPILASVSWDYAGSFTQSTYTEVDGWPAISKATSWLNATASYAVTPRIKVYIEGKNLTNTIVRTFLNGDENAIWSAGATGTGSGVDSGYSAFGRTITVGVGMSF